MVFTLGYEWHWHPLSVILTVKKKRQGEKIDEVPSTYLHKQYCCHSWFQLEHFECLQVDFQAFNIPWISIAIVFSESMCLWLHIFLLLIPQTTNRYFKMLLWTLEHHRCLFTLFILCLSLLVDQGHTVHFHPGHNSHHLSRRTDVDKLTNILANNLNEHAHAYEKLYLWEAYQILVYVLFLGHLDLPFLLFTHVHMGAYSGIYDLKSSNRGKERQRPSGKARGCCKTGSHTSVLKSERAGLSKQSTFGQWKANRIGFRLPRIHEQNARQRCGWYKDT